MRVHIREISEILGSTALIGEDPKKIVIKDQNLIF